MPTILLIVQARMGSTRLPGKVMKEVLGKPLIAYLLDRLKQLKHAVKTIVATTTSENDNVLFEFVKKYGFSCFRGSENDVLDRFYRAAQKYPSDIIIRITGDCPLIDPKVIDLCIDEFLKGNVDYLSNANPPTYPDGLDTEIFSFKTLETAWKEANKTSEREHVTPYLYTHPEKFRLGNVKNDADWSKLRLTVDEPEDFILISKIMEVFVKRWKEFTIKEVVDFLDKEKKLTEINQKFERNEGYKKSLKEDKIIKK